MRADGHGTDVARPSTRLSSAADAELLDDALVPLLVLALHVVEELAALAHHLQEAAARVVVFLVRLEVLGQIVDPLREDRDLHLRRAGIVGLGGIVLDERALALWRNRHRASFLFGGGRGQCPSRSATAGMSSSRVENRLGVLYTSGLGRRGESREALHRHPAAIAAWMFSFCA